MRYTPRSSVVAPSSAGSARRAPPACTSITLTFVPGTGRPLMPRTTPVMTLPRGSRSLYRRQRLSFDHGDRNAGPPARFLCAIERRHVAPTAGDERVVPRAKRRELEPPVVIGGGHARQQQVAGGQNDHGMPHRPLRDVTREDNAADATCSGWHRRLRGIARGRTDLRRRERREQRDDGDSEPRHRPPLPICRSIERFSASPSVTRVAVAAIASMNVGFCGSIVSPSAATPMR